MLIDYIKIGFNHVMPLGYDHILFIIALFFFNSKLKTAIIQCSIFTIAHSVTLALATLGYIEFNSNIIEALIAFSIFLISFENINRGELKWWRIAMVFAFGLFHGCGFASSLKQAGLPPKNLIEALLGFNLGVEFAQVLVILLCYYFLAKWYRNKEWYHERLVKPLSFSISCIALFWTVVRFMAI